MNWPKDLIGGFLKIVFNERQKDYRESSRRIYESIIQKDSQINTIILTGSIAGLTAIAALSKDIFISSGLISVISFLVVVLFVLVILLSVVNLYISTLVLSDINKKLIKNFKDFKRVDAGMQDLRFKFVQKTLNKIILISFCFGLVLLLFVLGLYIFGVKK